MMGKNIHELSEREEMAYAAREIAKNMRLFQERIAPASKSIAEQIGNCAALFEFWELEAKGDRPIGPTERRTCGRLFEQIAIKLGELAELLADIEDPEKTAHDPLALGSTVTQVIALTTDITNVLDLRVSGQA